jgi:EAL domain-containing protein (putative c-di-GMP-specific phosphodiesterase class I)
MPVDILKIPAAIVDTAGVCPEWGTPGASAPSGLLAGILALGRHLGLMTVAEGIERPEQCELLQALGCDLGQGYLLGRPLPPQQAGELLVSARR